MSEFLKPGTPEFKGLGLPWKVYDQSKDEGEPGFPFAIESTVKELGKDWVAQQVWDENDARYIVTACNAYPALIEALKATETDLSRLNDQVSYEVWQELYGTAFRIREALRKAGVK